MFSVGSWLVLLGVDTVKTGKEMFTSVQSQDPQTAAPNSAFKVNFALKLFKLPFLSQTLGLKPQMTKNKSQRLSLFNFHENVNE